MKKFDIALPNGSLWNQLKHFMCEAGYLVSEPDSDKICGETEHFRFIQVDRRSVPKFIDHGGCIAGITGYDLYLDSAVTKQETLAKLNFARTSMQPTRWVLACTKEWSAENQSGPVRISTELTHMADILLQQAKIPFEYEIIPIEGSEEIRVNRKMSDMVLVVTESGNSLRRSGLRILEGCEELLISQPRIFAKPCLPETTAALLADFVFALKSVVDASRYVMLSSDIKGTDFERLLPSFPSDMKPTVSPLTQEDWVAFQICILRSDYGRIGRMISEKGGREIVMHDLDGYHSGQS